MSTPHKASADQWHNLYQCLKLDRVPDHISITLELAARVEALEAAQPAPVVPLATASASSLARRFLVPPHGLVDEWFDRARRLPSTPLGVTRKVAEWAAQWGADQAIGPTFTAEAAPAPASSLVERVAIALARPGNCTWDGMAADALREVGAWLRESDRGMAASFLEQEAER